MPLRPGSRALFLLWSAAAALRVTMLSLPPLLPSIHRDLRLSETLVGALSALPVLLLAVAAVWGSLLVARVGARRALILGLCVVAAAGALRGLGTSTLVLFLMTFFMGVGIAVSQPTLPSLARAWFNTRSSLATAVYGNGFLVGEIVAASLTVPFILPLVLGSWQLAFAWWSIPVALAAIALAVFSSHEEAAADAARVRWWPDWKSARTWRIGLILGCASSAYFGCNAFLPDYLRATHHGGLIGAALTSVNLSQFPASFVVGAFPHLVVARRWPVVAVGVAVLVGVSAFYLGGVWVIVSAGVIGFSTATVFVLTIALPPLLTDKDDVHRLSAAIFTITYACPFVISFAGGAIWDATGIPFTVFLPIAATGIAMIVLVVGLNLPAWSETRLA